MLSECVPDAATTLPAQWVSIERTMAAAAKFGFDPQLYHTDTAIECGASAAQPAMPSSHQHNNTAVTATTTIPPPRDLCSPSSPQIVQKGSRFFVAPIGYDIVVIRALMREKGFLHADVEQPTVTLGIDRRVAHLRQASEV